MWDPNIYKLKVTRQSFEPGIYRKIAQRKNSSIARNFYVHGSDLARKMLLTCLSQSGASSMSVLLKATTSRVPKGPHSIKLRTEQGCTNSGTPGWQGDYNFFTVAPNVCGVLRMGLAHVTFLAPGIVWWFLVFWKKMCIPTTVYRGPG